MATKISTTAVSRKKVFRGWKVYLNGVKYPKKPVELYECVSEKEAVEQAFKEAGLDTNELKDITWGSTPHRKLTEKERNRMVDIYTSGPLYYKPEIDDPLFALDLIGFYDEGDEPKAVEAKHEESFFYAKNGSVLPEWYDPDPKPKDEMKLPPGMTCEHCTSFSRCTKFCGAKADRTTCDWSPSRFKEMEYHCYDLALVDIQEVAEQRGLLLEGIDIEDVISSIKKGIEWALTNRD
ncbi:MAG: hypothetical protein PHH85_02250 [Candidatus Methanoperedens sp.]|nr:hypothetical protein [Candidatus Methanoperedens sp.]